MQTADYALVISIFSATISLLSLVWNIWSKFLNPKSKVQISFFMGVIIDSDLKHNVICLRATNHGPGDITLDNIVCREAIGWNWMRLERKWQYGLLNPLDDPYETQFTRGPISGGLPKSLKMGERHTFYLVARHETFRDKNIVDVGFSDIYNRYLWSDRSSVRRVRNEVAKLFTST